MSALFPQERREVAPGAVHVPGWLDAAAQARLLEACRAWARPPAGLRTVVLPGGGVMSVRMVSLGWTWRPYHYVRTTEDGEPVKPFPGWLGDLGRRAVAEVYDDAAAAAYHPDLALVNFYDDHARMGLHQDAYEGGDDPVVSLSLGDTCVFRFGNTETRGRPWTDVELESGDLFVFGGPSRFAYHGVPKTYPGTAEPALGLRGRLNITIRVSGLSPRPSSVPEPNAHSGTEQFPPGDE
ncbi:alpha-ketoglutarate-dependent dioxygenase AlkB family protein [Yinghuangia seranimata]|uniref:alpha-ketoglutarate-dependent dioxygenase AlkB family protein n=1 Tax=Yinghuangia seranimata TaxID=408067 RepID=UPI00248B768D|nr:alpha-ketoglutarate-dependent dioxygenase AlkB [Yinghuangia seranimata]MDI2130001.1 alpha-ketoglutarate-dependent dioxygenase AlkB [Yinghuangia seranimata]